MDTQIKRPANIIGIIVGVIIIIIGISVMNPETYLLGERDSLGSLIEFGADFYTEIYHMTYQVGHQVQTAYVNICNAIGWLIVAIGAFDVCYFFIKLFDDNSLITTDSKPIEKDVDVTSVQTAPIVAKPVESKPVIQKSIFEKPVAPPAGKWICKNCNTENSINYGQCKKCGTYRGAQ